MESLLVIFVGIWLMAGGIVNLCAVEFLGVKPSIIRIIAVLILWPKAIRKSYWLHEDTGRRP